MSLLLACMLVFSLSYSFPRTITGRVSCPSHYSANLPINDPSPSPKAKTKENKKHHREDIRLHIPPTPSLPQELYPLHPSFPFSFPFSFFLLSSLPLLFCFLKKNHSSLLPHLMGPGPVRGKEKRKKKTDFRELDGGASASARTRVLGKGKGKRKKKRKKMKPGDE